MDIFIIENGHRSQDVYIGVLLQLALRIDLKN